LFYLEAEVRTSRP